MDTERKSHTRYYELSALLVRRAGRRANIREEPGCSFTPLEDEEEDRAKLLAELSEINSETTDILAKMREYEKHHDDLGIHQIERQVGRPFTDPELTMIWYLFWNSYVNGTNANGQNILLAITAGGVADVIANRVLLQSDSALRSAGIVVAERLHRHSQQILTERYFSLTESVIRILSDNDSANIATYECLRLDHDLFDVESNTSQW